jgi:hypothetical protein
VQECGSSDYDLEPGKNVTIGQITVPFSGVLLDVGGHLHDFGKGLSLESATRGVEIARLTPEADARGWLLSMPIVTFFMEGGYRLVITTTPNDGFYTDDINKRGGGSYTYQICEEGTATCSNEATVTF